ncbi:hypothetical protein A2865_02730 [Candidatus Woesebacteria bacterium RIFCSPHIGHO2_01_FULL_39_17]|uniref:Uncharacterized protein n=3 Tax=Candidatus Woeseibacteriota TaxID=1752722 RepID=A0A0G0RHZ9_9BACT|nr:MAG: hypothetical protein US72_C0004G0075 [Microgenomates group bacterium GW2011_GWC1_38_12]KKQ93366.1 MAG: hypothetical protein UT19_C0013G0030 [Candidatus Woesebacteria bacterium GW2011_GWB1_39_10b]KKR13292.1 MAG: hypothetical protein UT40_C0020G0013 [Candidatus Woesebacteria bacterium GW2011_GWA1_39_21b]OGM23219.1 MAG: hypothetical protein A2865_02730 [Candidatus Woesebacteria bacterium RIFCSPHIGHO2_01_FULL_39_17]OGM61125.1 MAG: hypothetical protein A3A52_04005 [Candidatus Woesebacteria b
MEEKQIYTYSRWKKLEDKFNLVKQEVQKTIQDFKAKPRKLKPSLTTTPIETSEIIQTPITEKASLEKPKLKKASLKKSKPKISRRLSLEFDEKILTYTLLFAIIVIIGLGIFLGKKGYQPSKKLSDKSLPTKTLSPTPTTNLYSDEISGGWKTYTDNLERYSYSYPLNWKLSRGNPNQIYNYSSEESSNGDFNPALDEDKIKIEIYTSSKPYSSLEEFLSEQEKLWEFEFEREYEETFINNQRALKTRASFSVGFNTVLLVFLQNPSTKKVHSFSAMPRYDVNKEIIDQILSTFRFLDENEPNATNEGQFCGGIAGIECLPGYICKLEGNYPDAGGYCVKEEVKK